MSKIPNFYAMSLPELLELRKQQNLQNQKYLEEQRKKGAKAVKRLGTAQKALKTTADATKKGGFLQRLLASFGKESESES